MSDYISMPTADLIAEVTGGLAASPREIVLVDRLTMALDEVALLAAQILELGGHLGINP